MRCIPGSLAPTRKRWRSTQFRAEWSESFLTIHILTSTRSSSSSVKKTKSEASDELPIKPLIEQLTFVRQTFREILRHYGSEIETEILRLAKSVATEAEKKIKCERVHDFRDILMLLRDVEVHPKKGKRRDLKRIESLVKDIRDIVDRWK